jgi:large subunit ribosomal protein L10
MLLTKQKKEVILHDLDEQISGSTAILIVNYQGLKVKEINELKDKLAEKGITFQVIKNSLFKIALKKANIVIDETLLDQPVAIIWGHDDEVTPSKIAVEFGKVSENLVILGGIINGKTVDKEIIMQLSALPGREELYAKLVGTLNAPMTRLVGALQGNLRSLVYILDQYKNSKN